jgi:hypothetical protein
VPDRGRQRQRRSGDRQGVNRGFAQRTEPR